MSDDGGIVASMCGLHGSPLSQSSKSSGWQTQGSMPLSIRAGFDGDIIAQGPEILVTLKKVSQVSFLVHGPVALGQMDWVLYP